MIKSFGKYVLMLYYIFLKPEKLSVYWKRFLDEVIQLGVKSLFIVSLMSAFMGAVLVIQTATAIESAWIPDYTVGFTVKQSMLLEFCPTIISLILDGTDPNEIQLRVKSEYKSLIDEIHENSNIQMITKAKNNEAILELLNELIKELKELDNLKKIESLEKELINNLDENSYSELIKLKSQLNRE